MATIWQRFALQQRRARWLLAAFLACAIGWLLLSWEAGFPDPEEGEAQAGARAAP